MGSLVVVVLGVIEFLGPDLFSLAGADFGDDSTCSVCDGGERFSKIGIYTG